jgi:hypothetical protein
LVACGGSGRDGDDDEDEPVDYVMIGVSGHCFEDCEEDLNVEYLQGQGTLDTLVAGMDDADGVIENIGFGDEYETWVWTDTEEVIVYGFLDLVYTLEVLRDDWFDSDHRVLMTCHSHGCVWAHTALFVVDDLVVDTLIDIDAESICWEEDFDCAFFGDDWADVIADDGGGWPYDIGSAANSWDIPGVSGYQDVEDVVPYNVRRNLEIGSNDTTFIQDAEPNHYPDGSTFGISRFESDENHEDSDQPRADGVVWAADQLAD